MERVRHRRRAIAGGAGDRYPEAAFPAFIPRRASSVRPPMSRSRSRASPRCCAAATSDFSDVTLDMTGIPAFNQRVYEFARSIPRGETRTYDEVASRCGASGAEHSVAQAIAPKPLHDHRALPSRAGGRALRRQELAVRRQSSPSAGCCRSRAPSRSPARRCSTCCCPLRRRARITRFRRHECDHASGAQIHDGVRFPLRRGAGRQAVRGAASLPLDLLCAQRQFWPALPRQGSANWWRGRC